MFLIGIVNLLWFLSQASIITYHRKPFGALDGGVSILHVDFKKA